MKQILILFLLALISCSESQDRYWIGNWACLSEEINPYFPYTELYFTDTLYAVQNNMIGTMVMKYEASGDTLFRVENNERLNIGILKNFNDTVMLYGFYDTLTLTRLPSEEKNYFDYGLLNENDEEKEKRFVSDFERRAQGYYVSSGMFNSIQEYEDYKKEIEDSTIIDFEDSEDKNGNF